MTYQRTFFERHRSAITAIAGAAIVGLLGLFVFASYTSAGYTCLDSAAPAATPSPGPSDRLGVVQSDAGNHHVNIGEAVTYVLCPPASGDHYNGGGAGPIQPRLYGPDEKAIPQGWIHNLEHGGMVVLYRCEESDACTDDGQKRFRDLISTLPPSPVCNLPAGNVSPVIARFEKMPSAYAALVWGRVLYLDTFDVDLIKRFYATEAESPNLPELLCPKPSPSIPIPSPTVVASPSASPSSGASPSPSSTAPAASASPEPSSTALAASGQGTEPSPSLATSVPD